MKCEEFQDRIGSLIESDEYTKALEKHLGECAQCAAYYRETTAVLAAVTPAPGPDAPRSLMENVRQGIGADKKGKSLRRTVVKMSKIAAVAAVGVTVTVLAIIGITQIPTEARAAAAILENALESTSQLRSMIMKFNVRTSPWGNFAYINVKSGMVPHTLTVKMGEPAKWRLEKKGATVVYDGETQFLWTPGSDKDGMRSKSFNFMEIFKLLSDPRTILLTETDAAKNNHTTHSIRETDSEIFLTVSSEAKGTGSPYMRTTTFEKFNNRREYIFDRQTHLIKSLKVYINYEGNDVLMLETTEIKYNVAVDEKLLTALPEGHKWVYMEVAPRTGSTIPAEKAGESSAR